MTNVQRRTQVAERCQVCTGVETSLTLWLVDWNSNIKFNCQRCFLFYFIYVLLMCEETLVTCEDLRVHEPQFCALAGKNKWLVVWKALFILWSFYYIFFFLPSRRLCVAWKRALSCGNTNKHRVYSQSRHSSIGTQQDKVWGESLQPDCLEETKKFKKGYLLEQPVVYKTFFPSRFSITQWSQTQNRHHRRIGINISQNKSSNRNASYKKKKKRFLKSRCYSAQSQWCVRSRQAAVQLHGFSEASAFRIMIILHAAVASLRCAVPFQLCAVEPAFSFVHGKDWGKKKMYKKIKRSMSHQHGPPAQF